MPTSSPSLYDFVLAWPLFKHAVLSSMFAGALLGVAGVYIVLKRMVFLSATLAQTASFGLTLSFYIASVLHLAFLQYYATEFAIIFTCLLLFYASKKQQKAHNNESLLAIFYLASLAGVLLLAPKITQEAHDVQQLLFGNAVAVLPSDYRMLAWISLSLGLLHLWWWRGFISVTLDPVSARVRALPTELIHSVLLLSIGIMITIYSQVLGSLTVFTLSVIPALSASRLRLNIPMTLILSMFIGIIAAAGGYIFAFLYDLPVGASQTFCALSLYLICLLSTYLIRFKQELTQS
jgi:zinc transport system permease protein